VFLFCRRPPLRQIMAVVLPSTPGFDPARDAGDLRGALKGFGTDDTTLIHIVGQRYPHEMMLIYTAYRQRHGRDLYDDIRGDTSGAYRELLLGLFHTPASYDADCLHAAMKRIGTDDTTLIEILSSRTNAEKAEIKQIYEREHKHSLRDDIKGETSGDYKDTLMGLLEPRDESGVVNPAAAKDAAERLYKAGEGKIGTDEKVFVEIFTRNGLAQLKAIAIEYHQLPKNKHHHTLKQAVDSEFSMNIKKVLLAILHVAEFGVFDYWADCAHTSMKGLGTDDTRLIRVILTAWHRYSIPQLKVTFNSKYSHSLHHWVRDETSFNYRKALLTLIGE